MQRPTINVCVCTYRRPERLGQLLGCLGSQETHGLFDYTVVVADNDRRESGRELVSRLQKRTNLALRYCVEPEQNIALARNRALSHAEGDYIAFIDDDELPPSDWLRTLFTSCVANEVDGVLGPVHPLFEVEPPPWVKRGGFFDRPTHRSLELLDWRSCRTGNALVRRKMIALENPPFRPEFGSGAEDRDFFRRLQLRGGVFVWCNEAAVSEVIPSGRWDKRFLLKRALLRGKASLADREARPRRVLTSLIAVPTYTVTLPLFVFGGRHVVMKQLMRLFDHLGRLLACMGRNPVKEVYLTR